MAKIIKLNQKNAHMGGDVYRMVEFLKLVLYLLNNCKKSIYRTKLNKLLFYTQFLYKKRYDKMLLEDWDFRYDYFGPVLENLDEKLEVLAKVGAIGLVEDQFGSIIYPKKVLDIKEYTQEEIDVLNRVINQFDSFTSREISEYSHKELFWNDDRRGQVIDIDDAEKLKDF